MKLYTSQWILFALGFCMLMWRVLEYHTRHQRINWCNVFPTSLQVLPNAVIVITILDECFGWACLMVIYFYLHGYNNELCQIAMCRRPTVSVWSYKIKPTWHHPMNELNILICWWCCEWTASSRHSIIIYVMSSRTRLSQYDEYLFMYGLPPIM